MITELTQEQFKNALPLNTYYNLEITAILSGNNSGRVFADDPQNPKTAIIWTDDGVFFIGDTNNKVFMDNLDTFMTETIKPLRATFGATNWYICGTSQEWDDQIRHMFTAHRLEASKQYVYRIKDMENLTIHPPVLENSFSIQPASVELLTGPYKNLDFFVDGILDFWPDVETFCEKGFGYFLISGDEIISRCTMDFKFDSTVTVGVATDTNHRKKGYAQVTASAVLNHCKEFGYSPYWDCMATNTGSIALATSLGFERDYTYTVFELDLSRY